MIRAMANETAPEERTVLDQMLNPDRQRRLRDMPRLIVQAFGVVWAAARRPFCWTVALQIVTSIATAAELLLSRKLLTQILGQHAGTYKLDFGAAVPVIIAMGAALAVSAAASFGNGEINSLLGELVSRDAAARMMDVSSSVDLISYENPEFNNRLQRAQIAASTRPLQMTNGLIGLGGSLTTLLGIAVALLIIQPFVLLVALLASLPLWLATSASSRALFNYARRQTARDRRRYYLQLILSQKETAAEVRAFDSVRFLRARWDRLYDERLADLRNLLRQRIRQGVAGALASGALTGGALALLLWFVANGHLSLPTAGAAAAAVAVLSNTLNGAIGNIGSLYESALFIRDFHEFADQVPKRWTSGAEATGRVGHPPFAEIDVHDVGFTYPSRTEPSLQGVSLSIQRGQVIALVGENGSGKTTLAKLLSGLYRPSTGRIEWDGVDTAEINSKDLRSHVAVLFQDYVRYFLTARDNVAIGRTTREPTDEAVVPAAARAGLDHVLTELPKGYDSMLGPQFDGGIDLSGGQWQRLALARAFYRDAELVVLDEPTAALDPRAEAELFGRVRDLFEGRTVVLISHRFASVRLADHIYVLDGGRLVEDGDHDALMARSGLYAELFNLQARAYADRPPTPPHG
jgi:ATP-binding cassette subfamily B protein